MRVTKDAPNPEAANAVLNDGESQETAVATRQPAALGRVTGEVRSSLKLPDLKIAYGVGKLSETFNQGDLVLDGTYLLAKRGEPLTIIIASVQTYWKQYLSIDQRAPGVVPKTYQTADEARKAGEVVDWPPRGSDGPKPTVSPAGVYQLLIQKPEGCECALFGFELGGKLWAPARWFLDKKAHRVVADEVRKAETFSLAARKGCLLAGQFTVKTATVKKPDGKTETLPSLKFSGNNSDADVDKIIAAFTGASAAIEDDRE